MCYGHDKVQEAMACLWPRGALSCALNTQRARDPGEPQGETKAGAQD